MASGDSSCDGQTAHGKSPSGRCQPKPSAFNVEQLATPGIQRNKWASTLYEPAEPDTGLLPPRGTRDRSVGRHVPPDGPPPIRGHGHPRRRRSRVVGLHLPGPRSKPGSSRAAATCASASPPTAESCSRSLDKCMIAIDRVQRTDCALVELTEAREPGSRLRRSAGGHRRVPCPPTSPGTSRAHASAEHFQYRIDVDGSSVC